MSSDSEKFENRSIVATTYKLEGDLRIPPNAKAIVLFLHGSGSSKDSTRNHYVAEVLNNAGFATLLIDLLTPEEKIIDSNYKHTRFDIDLLALRVESVTEWLTQDPETQNLFLGYFCSSTSAAAALVVASKLKNKVKAIVSRGGRPDLVEGSFSGIDAPTMFIVGGADKIVLGMNKRAMKQLDHVKAKELVVIPKAGHLFEEPGKMQEVARIASEWFERYLLGTGGKLENRHSENLSGLFSLFRERPRIQVTFKDRVAAGEMLASLLSKYRGRKDAIVIGIPRGGVVVANEVARKLDIEFNLVVLRRLPAPNNSEIAIGAIIHDGSVYLDESRIKSTQATKEYIDIEIAKQKAHIDSSMIFYRPFLNEHTIRNRTVILVDDGAATGATLTVAARWIRKQWPKYLIIAVPVAAKAVKKQLQAEADSVEVIKSPVYFEFVEKFYQDFSPVEDTEVLQALSRDLS